MSGLTMTISGTAVSCAQCLSLLMEGLLTVDGILNLSADKQANMLVIEYNVSLIDEAGIRAKLRGLGFLGSELYCIC